MTHLVYIAVHCTTPWVTRKKGSLDFLTYWISLPGHLGKCWQIELWRIK